MIKSFLSRLFDFHIEYLDSVPEDENLPDAEEETKIPKGYNKIHLQSGSVTSYSFNGNAIVVIDGYEYRIQTEKGKGGSVSISPQDNEFSNVRIYDHKNKLIKELTFSNKTGWQE